MKYLIAGLGNIGPEYHETRHNIGFMILDHLAAEKEAVFSPARYGDRAEFKLKGRTFILLKPSTYMNLSGRAIHYWMAKEKAELEHLLVVVDDIALPLGALRMKARGGAGGHNGLSHIIDILGTDQYARLRFGIGGDFPRGFQSQYVLGKWEPEERELIDPRIKMASEMVVSFGLQGAERTMNLFNKK
ncbi:MAG: aminoacyl-tRNA hydrolase [Bacteroides sp.]|jgi:PTH1 family peptidyl-tRNA hydrolase|nr:aminoacyl-tRNA hydrolase [Bacteroides sp.]